MVMHTDGSDIVNLTRNGAGNELPQWSPDGRYITFQSHRDGNAEIYVMNADGSNQRNLTNHASNDWEPSWGYLYGPQQELTYDDGVAGFGIAVAPPGMAAVKFSAGSLVKVEKLRFFVWGAQRDMRVHILDNRFNSVYSRLVIPGDGWLEVDISAENVFVSGDFYIGWQWITEGPNGPWLGFDVGFPHHQHSYIGVPAGIPQPAESDIDLMIRVVVRQVD
jgi:hypothetical protein